MPLKTYRVKVSLPMRRHVQRGRGDEQGPEEKRHHGASCPSPACTGAQPEVAVSLPGREPSLGTEQISAVRATQSTISP